MGLAVAHGFPAHEKLLSAAPDDGQGAPALVQGERKIREQAFLKIDGQQGRVVGALRAENEIDA